MSRRSAHDALETFLSTAQQLDAANTTSRLSQVQRFQSQAGQEKWKKSVDHVDS